MENKQLAVIEEEQTQEVQTQVAAPVRQMSQISADTLKKVVMSLVLAERYDVAIKEIERFAKLKSDYPEFHPKTQRYLNHSIDLIHAIKAKKRFPGMSSLTRPKIQEMNERTMEHFNELAYTLRKIEYIRVRLQTADSKSTLWFLRSVLHSVWIIAVTAIVLEMSAGLYKTGYLVFDDLMDMASTFVVNLFG